MEASSATIEHDRDALVAIRSVYAAAGMPIPAVIFVGRSIHHHRVNWWHKAEDFRDTHPVKSFRSLLDALLRSARDGYGRTLCLLSSGTGLLLGSAATASPDRYAHGAAALSTLLPILGLAAVSNRRAPDDLWLFRRSAKSVWTDAALCLCAGVGLQQVAGALPQGLSWWSDALCRSLLPFLVTVAGLALFCVPVRQRLQKVRRDDVARRYAFCRLRGMVGLAAEKSGSRPWFDDVPAEVRGTLSSRDAFRVIAGRVAFMDGTLLVLRPGDDVTEGVTYKPDGTTVAFDADKLPPVVNYDEFEHGSMWSGSAVESMDLVFRLAPGDQPGRAPGAETVDPVIAQLLGETTVGRLVAADPSGDSVPGEAARLLGLEPVHMDAYGDLFVFAGERADSRYVRVRDPATVPGGDPFRWLAVPPHVQEAHEGVAWTYGLTAAAHSPTLEG